MSRKHRLRERAHSGQRRSRLALRRDDIGWHDIVVSRTKVDEASVAIVEAVLHW
jgi:hypothetical protein